MIQNFKNLLFAIFSVLLLIPAVLHSTNTTVRAAAQAVDVAPVDAPAVEPAPDAAAIDAGTIDAAATSSAAMTSSPSTGGEFGEAGTSVSAPTNNTFAGSASFSIPIQVLPGRLGVAPSVTLSYSSMGGNGFLGVGWNLDMGSIQRRTKDGLNYTVDDFIFSKGGSTSDLVYVSGTTVKQYTAKIEDGSFIKFSYNTTSKVWTAYDKNGMVYSYGAAAASQLSDTAGTKIFKWALDKVTDTNGNYMTLSYYKDSTNRELYLDQIDYTGNTNTGLTPTNRVKFNRDSGNRPDAATNYLPRFSIKTIYRLASVQVQAKINGAYATSRTYVLSYSTSPSTDRSILSSVVLYGSDNTAMPETLFDYQQGQTGLYADEYWASASGAYATSSGGFRMADMNGDGIADFVYEVDTHNSTAGIRVMLGTGSDFLFPAPWGNRLYSYDSSSKGFRLADMNGDGLPDYVYDHNGIHVLLNTGNGSLLPDDATAVWGTRSTGYESGSGGFRLADMNRDGLPDVIYERNRNIHVLINTGTGLATDAVWATHSQGVSITSGGFQMVDMNGDGMADFVYDNSKNMRVLLSTGNGFQAEELWGARTQNYDNNFPGFRLADLNGDGLPDLIYDSESQQIGIRVLINTGTSFLTDVSWGSRLQHYSTNSGGFQMIDMNNDGLADFVYDQDVTKYIRVLLSTGSSFQTDDSTAVWGRRLESYRDKSPGFRVGDVNGDGIPDIVYDSDSGGNNTHALISKGPFPDLITNVDNGIGGTFTLVYTPSSTPGERIHETLPFVLQTVESITATTMDANGQMQSSTTNYTYSGGFYDLEDREFRGLGYAKQINPDSSTYETWNHQRDTGQWYWNGTAWVNWPNCHGSMADDDDYRGKPCHTELKDPNAVLLSTTDMQWGRSVSQGTYPVFVRPTGKDVSAYIGGTTITNQENYYYNDNDGTLTSVNTSGPGADPITTENSYQYYGAGGTTYPLRTTGTTVKVTGAADWIRKTTFIYENLTGNLLTKKFWLDDVNFITNTMTYWQDGNLHTKTDPKGNTTSYNYDATTATFPARTDYSTTNGVPHFDTATYNYLYGKVDCATDENLNDTCAGYDPFGRPNEGISYSGNKLNNNFVAKTRTEYHNTVIPNYVKKSVLETITGIENYIEGYSFVDGFGRKIEAITFGEAGKSIVSKAFYDTMGRANYAEGPFFGLGYGFLQTTPADAPWSETRFNYFGKPIELRSPYAPGVPAIASIAYNGLSTTVTDPDGNSKKETKDYLGRVIEVIEYDIDTQQQPPQPVYYHTNYEYNAAGDLLSVTDNDGNTTNMSYDKLGRKSDMTDPDMGYWVYDYDPNGNLWHQTDAKSQTITFDYDELNRVRSKTYNPVSSDNPPVLYTYDNLTIPNGRGKLYSVNNTKAATIYNEYDAMGRATSSTKTIQGDATQYTTATTYDYSGKPKVMTYPVDGFTVTNTYHPGSGLLHEVTGSDGKIYARNTLYEPTGKIGQIDHPANNTHEAYTYDPTTTKLVSIISESPASDGQPKNDLINRGYIYTPAGNVAIITDYKKGNQLGLPDDIFNYEYQYDKLHRYTTEAFKDSTGANVPMPFSPAAYTYNAIGNILSKSVGNSSFAYTYDPQKKHAVNSITVNGGTTYNFGYDLNGNMINGYDLTDLQNIAARTIGYNADNMPVQVLHSRYGTTNISYDGTSNRVKKVSPSGTTYYIGDHYEVKNNEPIKYIFAGELRVAKVAATGTYFFHKDHLGSSAVMTDGVTGAIIEESNYMPFGEIREQTGIEVSNYKFTDQEFDPETGLYYYGARYYDPTIGRFIAPDSLIQAPFDPQTLNRYTYCRNNPIRYTDPDGHLFGIDDLTIGVLLAAMAKGAVVGAAVGAGVAVATGSDVGMGALTGAIGGAIFGAAGAVVHGMEAVGSVASITKAGIHAAAGMLSGGINSGITGGDIGVGMLAGGLAAGISAYAGAEYFPQNDLAQVAGRVMLGGAIGGAISAASGGNFGQGFTIGGTVALLGELLNDMAAPDREKEYGVIRKEPSLSLTEKIKASLMMDYKDFTEPSLPSSRIDVFMKYQRYALDVVTVAAGTNGDSYNFVTRNIFRWERGAWGNPQGAEKLHFHLAPATEHHLPYQIRTWFYHSLDRVKGWF